MTPAIASYVLVLTALVFLSAQHACGGGTLAESAFVLAIIALALILAVEAIHKVIALLVSFVAWMSRPPSHHRRR